MNVPLFPPGLRRPDLEAACDALARAAAPLLPLMRAAADGRLSLCILKAPDAPWPARALGEQRLPVVVLVGDDPGPHPEAALGPQAWKAAERLRRWCRWAMVHGAGGEPAHYAAAVEAAEAVRRVALVETSSLRAMAWRRFLGPAGLTILPPAGAVHPLRAALQ